MTVAKTSKHLKVAILHDYCYTYGGAERTVEEWLTVYPEATIITGFFHHHNMRNSKLSEHYAKGLIRTTFSQWILSNCTEKVFKYLFWIHPVAALTFPQVRGYDLVLISSVYTGKYFLIEKNQPVIHYAHSPTRFLYPKQMRSSTNQDRLSWISRILLYPVLLLLRWWDQTISRIYAGRNNWVWVTNSGDNQRLLHSIYDVSADIIYPPVDPTRFYQNKTIKNYNQYQCLVYSRIVPIKYIERAMIACKETNTPLTILGNTADTEYVEKLNNIIHQSTQKHTRIEIISDTDPRLKQEIISQSTLALLPGEEDFGIAAIELIGSGIPLIAPSTGGSIHYLQPQINGLMFDIEAEDELQTIANLKKAIEKAKKIKWDQSKISHSVSKFSGLHIQEIQKKINQLLS